MINQPAIGATGSLERAPSLSRLQRMRRFVVHPRNRSGLAATLVLAVVVLAALAAPWVAPHDPVDSDLKRRLLPPAWMSGGDWSYLLGTDQLGRDILSRIIWGGRISLLVGFCSVLLAGLVGILLGVAAGYYRGWVDDIIGRLIDIQLAVPYLLLAIALVMTLGSSLRNLIGVLVLYGWTIYARVVRSDTLSVREREYVAAARLLGFRNARVMLRHVLPNVISPLIVVATLELANMITFEAGLSFLGLGVQPPTPSWGGMLSDGRDYVVAGIWWPATFPGLALSITILSINMIGDWLRDLLDPRRRR